MGANRITQAVVRTDVSELDQSQAPLQLVLFNEDGTQFEWPDGSSFTPAEAQEDSIAVDVEDLVDDFNALLAKLRAAGIMEEPEE